MNIGSITVELIVGFIALFTITKIIGKTQISHLTPFDFISSLVLGEFVGAAIYEDRIHVGMVLFTIILWGLLVFVMEKVTQKFRFTRRVLEGNPSIVIRDGKIDRKELQSNKLDINQLLSLLRQKDIFSVRVIKYAILEINGAISIIKQPEDEKGDRDHSQNGTSLTFTLISDGKIDNANLQEAGLNKSWLLEQLKKGGVSNLKDVFYGEWNKQDGFYMQKIGNS